MNAEVEDLHAENANLFKVHFILSDGSHRMDALTLHKCEGELLSFLKEVSNELEFRFDIEAAAYGEGGLIVYLKLIGSHAQAISLIGSAVVAIFTAGAWVKYQSVLLDQQISQNDLVLNRDRKLADQQIEQNDIAIQKAKIELARMLRESAKDGPKSPKTDSALSLPLESPLTAEQVIPSLLTKHRILKYRSQFYEHLSVYEKVSAVGFAASNNESENNEVVVSRADFNSYILDRQQTQSTVVSGAEVEIVSPVFKRDTFKWKGIFESKGIAFDISDDEFISKVESRKIKFQRGTTILCDLEIDFKERLDGGAEHCVYTVKNINKHFTKKVPTAKVKLAGASFACGDSPALGVNMDATANLGSQLTLLPIDGGCME